MVTYHFGPTRTTGDTLLPSQAPPWTRRLHVSGASRGRGVGYTNSIFSLWRSALRVTTGRQVFLAGRQPGPAAILTHQPVSPKDLT